MSAQTSTLFLIADLVYLKILYVVQTTLRDDHVRATICGHFYDRKFSIPLVKEESKFIEWYFKTHSIVGLIEFVHKDIVGKTAMFNK